MINIKTNEPGNVIISDEAIAVIAGTAALEAEGVVCLSGNLADGVSGKLGRKNLSKGVIVASDDNAVRVTAQIIVKTGMKVHDVAKDAQIKIKTAIETMTGLEVSEVNITVNAAAEKVRSA